MKTSPRKEAPPAPGPAGPGAPVETVGGPLTGESVPTQGESRASAVSTPGCRVTPLIKTTVLLVDDNAAMRRSLRRLLEAEGNSKVVGQARNGREAVQLARTLRPDVILMDIAMPVLNGLEAMRQILAANPAAKVLILSAHGDDEYIRHLTAVGAMGYLEKLTAAAILPKAISEVARGNLFFGPGITRRMVQGKK